MSLSRREFIKLLSASAAAAGVTGCATASNRRTGARVVVIGAGYGGATAAKYIRMWSPDIQVTLVERDSQFISCPLSNRVLAGVIQLKDLTRDYGQLQINHGVKLVRDDAVAVDPVAREVRLAGGTSLKYDRLIVSPGVDLVYDSIPGMREPAAQERVLHAWKAGRQTVALRRQLEGMRDGGVYAITVPRSPYRCPPGPYERACQVAYYFKQAKPRSKVLILDANDDVQSKKGLFMKVWKEIYPGIVEYRPNSGLVDVDVSTMTAKLDFEDVGADVLNVVPPQRAGRIAREAGLITANDRWCEVDFLTYESVAVKNIHVLGDAIMAAPQMPKSGHMANQHAKVCAAAVIALLHGDAPNPEPIVTNTCYSFVSDRDVVHVASVHAYDREQKTMLIVDGASGVSPGPSTLEGQYAESWGRNIWNDMLS
ncbi:MAG TPA: NAD(P)/FAD-dependent oxidoreductase [Burkholderiales bacterium]|nr:NAD(P)/FAD-dependent oxidoreductase [Burkholderiales bacterium]